jgi:pimeloyl-ACP methyl ester carboxylesterase
LIAKVRDLDVRYELEGPEGAPVVCFVHGIAASLEVWAKPAAELAGRYRVLRFDLRSHGQSSAPDAPVTRHDLAADLIGLLDVLGIDRIAVVGHSAGGVIAMHTALDFPERVWALGLVGTASECNDKTAQWYTKCIEKGRSEGGEGIMKAMGMKPGTRPVPDGVGAGHVIAAMRTLNADPLTERMRGLALPTFIIVGEKDFLGAGGSVILSRAVAGSELHIVPERGHGIYLEDPAGFSSLLGAFLDKARG